MKVENGITLYDAAEDIDTMGVGTIRIGSTRDDGGQKWYLYLVRRKDGKYNEMFRSVYLHFVFDFHFKSKITTEILPPSILSLAGSIMSKIELKNLFNDPALNTENQIEAEIKSFKNIFNEESFQST